jgi:hypothetical protein
MATQHAPRHAPQRIHHRDGCAYARRYPNTPAATDDWSAVTCKLCRDNRPINRPQTRANPNEPKVHFAPGGCRRSHRLRETDDPSQVTCANCLSWLACPRDPELDARPPGEVRTIAYHYPKRRRPLSPARRVSMPPKPPRCVHHEDGCGHANDAGALMTSQPDLTTCVDCLHVLLARMAENRDHRES